MDIMNFFLDDYESNNVDEVLSSFDFHSTRHQRYQSGTCVMGLQICPRYISIRKNVNGCTGYKLVPGDGYILRAINGDTGQQQFAPKPMRVVSSSGTEIVLRGYSVIAQSPFGWVDFDLSDYGFTIHLSNGVPYECILHMYDRDVDIIYK